MIRYLSTGMIFYLTNPVSSYIYMGMRGHTVVICDAAMPLTKVWYEHQLTPRIISHTAIVTDRCPLTTYLTIVGVIARRVPDLQFQRLRLCNG